MTNINIREQKIENKSFGDSAKPVTGLEGIDLNGFKITKQVVDHLKGKGYSLYTTESFRRARNGVVNNNYWLILTDGGFDQLQHKSITPGIQDRWVTLDSSTSRDLGKQVLESLIVLPSVEKTQPKAILSKVPGAVNVHAQMVDKTKTDQPLGQTATLLKQLEATLPGKGARKPLNAIAEEREPLSLVTEGQLHGPLAGVLSRGSASGAVTASRLGAGAGATSSRLYLENRPQELGRTQPSAGTTASRLALPQPSAGTTASRLLGSMPPPPAKKGGKRNKRTRRFKRASKKTRKH